METEVCDMLYTSLTVFAAVLGLLVTGSAVYTAWYLLQQRGKNTAPGAPERQALLRWTVFDYALLTLVLVGLVFLLVDLIGVLKDKDLYPYYHYGYLLSGFIFTLLGLVFMLARLSLVLRLANQNPASPYQGNEPDKADNSK
jgi:hypothetical protein